MSPTSSTRPAHWEPGQAKLPGMTVRRKNRRFWLLNLGTVCERWLNLRKYVWILSHVQKNPSLINFWSEKNEIIHLRIIKRRNIKTSNGKIGDWHEELSKIVWIDFHFDLLKYFFEFRISKLLEIRKPKNDFIHFLEDETKKRIPFEIEPPLLSLAYVHSFLEDYLVQVI